jgi:polysaccharide export outer membrane protein
MKDNRNHLGFVTLLISAFLVVGLSSTLRAQPQSGAESKSTTTQTTAIIDPALAASQRYRIGPGDILDIRILNRPQLSRESVRVDGNGAIRMPLIESEILAACKSEAELAKEIASRYLKYYRNPQVDVFVKEFHAREVALIGAVNQQGRYQMQRRLRLLELLTFAKGPSEKAGQTINIVRGPRTDVCSTSQPADDPGSFISLRLNDTLRGEEKANPYMESGDIVTIPDADVVYVIGNVYSPKALPMKEPLTVTRAIAMAGGPLRDSKTDKIRIVRQTKESGFPVEIIVNLKAIAKKEAEDIPLLPNDVVQVQESTSKVMLRTLMGAVVPSIGQLPVRVVP